MDPKEKKEQVVHDTKSNLILNAARSVFSEKGLHATRLEDIAMAAGFSKASLYNYYSDKDDIFLRLALRELDELTDKLKIQFDAKQSFSQNLEIFVRTILQSFHEHYTFLLVMNDFRLYCQANHKINLSGDDMLKRFKIKYSVINEQCVNILRVARKKTEVTSSLSDSVLADFILSLIRGVFIDWKLKNIRGDIEREIKQVLSFVEAGVGNGSGKQTGRFFDREFQSEERIFVE